MAITLRALLKSLLGLSAVLAGGARSAAALQAGERLTLTDLIARIRRSSALRDRFADDPRAVLREYGIDPAPYNLPDRIDPSQMQRLLAQFAQAPAPNEPPIPPSQPAGPPAPVYGPPPGPSPGPPQPPRTGPSPRPPAPVYGPPPGFPR